MKHAAERLGNKYKVDALALKVFYEDEETSFSKYTVGNAIWAPDGDWGSAGKSYPMRVNIRDNLAVNE